MAFDMPDNPRRADVRRRMCLFDIRFTQSRTCAGNVQADMERLHQEDTSAFSRRGEARKDCHPCSCGIRDISIRSNIYGHIPVFIIRAVVSGSRTGRYADVRSCNAVQYRHCFRRDCITRQFLLIQSCTQALHELPDDNRTTRAFHDNNPFQQKLLGTRQIDIKHCRIKPQCAGK